MLKEKNKQEIFFFLESVTITRMHACANSFTTGDVAVFRITQSHAIINPD